MWIENLGGWPAVIGYVLGNVGIIATIVAYYRAKIVKTVDWIEAGSSPLVQPFESTPAIEVLVNGAKVASPDWCS